jgi:hypothetical protein
MNSCNSDMSAVLSPGSAITCRASSFVVIGPGASRNASSVARVRSPRSARCAAILRTEVRHIAEAPAIHQVPNNAYSQWVRWCRLEISSCPVSARTGAFGSKIGSTVDPVISRLSH